MKSLEIKIPIVIVVTSVIIAFFIVSDIPDKFFVRQSFEKAFLHRTTGNCDDFMEYIASNKEEWSDRCQEEKDEFGDIYPIKNFEIMRIDISDRGEEAFLQAQLERNEDPYVVNYDMVKLKGFRWGIANEINKE